MSQKFILTFNLDQKIEEEVTKEQIVDGKTLKVIETVSSIKPVEFGLLKSSRRLTEQADLFYAKMTGFYTSEGLLSVHQINKRYENDGGVFNKDENKFIENLSEQKKKLAERYFELSQKEKKSELDSQEEKQILEKSLNLQRQIDSVSTSYTSIFNQTAEYKARNKLITFWTMFLLHRKNEEGEWKRVIDVKRPDDFTEGEDAMFDIEDSDNEFDQESLKKGMYYVSYWSGGGDENEESVKNAEKAYVVEFGDYLDRDYDDLFPEDSEEKEDGESKEDVDPVAVEEDDVEPEVEGEKVKWGKGNEDKKNDAPDKGDDKKANVESDKPKISGGEVVEPDEEVRVEAGGEDRSGESDNPEQPKDDSETSSDS